MRRNLFQPRSKAALLLTACAAVATLSAATAAQTTKPNLIYILIDDLRWDALSVTGSPLAPTPNIDRIGKEGMVFRNAFVTLPLCSPSRASFLTGQYARTHGIRDNTNRGPLSHRIPMFPRALQNSGYETAYIGKLHMGNDDAPRPGFDHWVSFKGQGAYIDPMININGAAEKKTGYMTDLLSDYAVEFVKKTHNKPFFMALAHKAVHGPFTPAERHKGLVADQPVKRSPGAADTLEGKPVLTREVMGPMGRKLGPVKPGGGSGDELIRNQIRCVQSIDEGVGKLLAALKDTAQLDNTVLVFTSDNGYFWGEHGLGDKRFAYEESIRIPFLVRYPRLVKAGSVSESMILNVDLAPTFLELAGATAQTRLNGRSIVPLLSGKSDSWRKSAYFEYFHEPQFPRCPTWEAVRTAEWKLVRYPEVPGADELYDLKRDPHELKNLAAAPDAAARRRELEEELKRLKGEIEEGPGN